MGGRNRDANISIRIPEDGMEARGELNPPLGKGSFLSRRDVEATLNEAGITEGIDWETIESALETVRQERTSLSVVLARGRPPVDRDPAYLKLAQKLFVMRLYGKERGGRVDYHEVRPFVIVEKDEALGRYVPAAEGRPGVTVLGDPVPPGEKQRIAFEPGENIYRDGDYIRSSIAGRFVLQGRNIFVTEILELSGVDFHTGNIRYPGDVVLRGEIRDGFSVSCGGDLYAAVPLDATEVLVQGDVSVEGGIIGRKPGILKVGGNIQAKFLENVTLECRGNVNAEGGILQSRVYSLGTVACGEKGRVFNSRIYAVSGVEVQHLGNSSGQPTYISCGSDFRKLRRYKEIRRRQSRLRLKLDTLTALRKGSLLALASRGRLEEMIRHARIELEELEEVAVDALKGVDSRSDAKVVVRDTIYPGVTVDICQVVYRVTRQIPRGTFYLDSEHREIRILEM